MNPGHLTSEVEDYLAARVRQPYPPGCPVLPGSTPVISFGDVRSAWVATLGINPSDSEFVERGTWLEGDQRRFESLGSLGLSQPQDADDEQVARVVAACYGYFDGPNPYWRWFSPLQRVLSEGVGASYTDGSAAHLDLIQWATTPVWGKIADPGVRRTLIASDREFLRRQLQSEGIGLVLMNGRRVMTEVAALGVPLQPVVVSAPGEPRFEIQHGSLGGTEFLGWNLTFPNGGISTANRQLIIDTVRVVGGSLRPQAATQQALSIPKDTTVEGKGQLARVLRGWLTTGQKTVGDVGAFGGKPWIRIRLAGAEVVLNADTKRAAVQEYLDHVAAHGPDSPWQVIANTRGTINKVTFRGDGAPTKGWYAYTTKAQPDSATL